MFYAKIQNFCFKNFKRNSYTFRAAQLAEGGTLYRGPFDGGYISLYVVLNLVLTLFCQDKDEAIRRLEALAKGKAKNNRIPMMLIGQGRGGKTSLMRRLLALPLNPSAIQATVQLFVRCFHLVRC